MNCEKYASYADKYAFELLDEEERSSYEHHRKNCGSCENAAKGALELRKLFSTWKIRDSVGIADKAIKNTYTKARRKRTTFNSLAVRILAGAAVIIAALIIPRIFLSQSPGVLAYEAKSTTVEGVFHELVQQELFVPGSYANQAYIVVRLKTLNGKSPVEASLKLNDSEGNILYTSAASPEEVYILQADNGLKNGMNLLEIRNLNSGALEFEVTLMVGSTM